MTRQGLAGLLAILGIGSPALADVWREPNPMRRDTLIESRDFRYNLESFLNRFSYRHLSATPRPGDDGVRGTAGSVRSAEMFADIDLQKTLMFDDDRHGVFLRMQRFEDFDGDFDRQIVGFARRIGPDWRIGLAGDVGRDKAEIDIQFEAEWRPDAERLLRVALVLPEYYYNTKSESEGRYRQRPRTGFVHYREDRADGWSGEVALNYSPEARFIDTAEGIDARGKQTRLLAALSRPVGDWRIGAEFTAEHTDRDFLFSRAEAPGDDTFRRRMHALTVSASAADRPLQPELGIRHFRLREDGWFGDGFDVTGMQHHDETLAFASLTFDLSPRQQWQPTLYAGHGDARRTWAEAPERELDENRWIGKLALPWRYVVDVERGGVLTINPTIHLHRGAFGGGNIQLHWPF